MVKIKGNGKRKARFKTNLRQLMLDKSARKGTLITQKDLSESIGIGQATISRWVRGEIHEIDMDTLQRFANYFECEPADILVLDGKKVK